MVLGHDNNEFIIDTADFKNMRETQTELKKHLTCFDVEKKFVLNPFKDLKKINVELGTYGDISAFSMSWPLISFADRKGHVFLINAFRR